MEKKSIRTMRGLCYAVLVFSGIWFVLLCYQTYFIYTTGIGVGVINWNTPDIGVKLALSVGERVASVLTMGLCIAFVVNILRSVKQGVIFTRRNVTLLRVMAVVMPIYAMIRDNVYLAYLSGEIDHWSLTDTPFVYVMVLLIVAQLYKVACDVAEEQSLTI